MSDDLPLRGIRVLDLSRLLPGPFLTLVLSDLGAEVVKVEDLGPGDYLRFVPPFVGDLGVQFAALNRDKKGLLLDLKNPAGRDAFLRLCKRFDVVVESFRPGVLDRLGVGFEALRAANPRLVLCSVSGYGQVGPYRDRAGHDIGYVALSGLLGLTGRPAVAPGPMPAQVADIAGGALHGAVGILAALLACQRTGRGRHLDISMTEGAAGFLVLELPPHLAGQPAPKRGEGRLGGGLACYDVYETADGRFLAVGALEPKFWAAFCKVIGRASDASDLVSMGPKQDAIRAEVAAALKRRTRDEWVAAFEGVEACVEPVLDGDELRAHALHVARQLFFDIETPAGKLPQIRTPLGRADGHGPPPRPGQHTREVLACAGFTDAEIEGLARAGATRA